MREEGYTGSLKLNKEGALYQKIQTIRQARLLSFAAAPKAAAKAKGAPTVFAKPKECKRLRGKQTAAAVIRRGPLQSASYVEAFMDVVRQAPR